LKMVPFLKGSIQLAPFSEFGAELGLIHGERLAPRSCLIKPVS